MGGSMSLKAVTSVWCALTAPGARLAATAPEPVTEVIQRGVKQRLLKYLAASGGARLGRQRGSVSALLRPNAPKHLHAPTGHGIV